MLKSKPNSIFKIKNNYSNIEMTYHSKNARHNVAKTERYCFRSEGVLSLDWIAKTQPKVLDENVTSIIIEYY